ncbi:MAG: hypothetical protein JSR12_08635 [Bacteroidetes bacterium]|nr:hypothetical protein [Bacteroidota bacterium]
MIYKKPLAILLIAFTSILFLFNTSKAQSAAKSVYFELGGPGISSFNFDTRFNKREDGWGARFGVGGFSVDGEGVMFIPVGINYLVGKDQRNYFEMGGGATLMSASQNIFANNQSSSAFGFLQFGYRLQPKNGGFTFRANMTPVFGRGFFVPYYFGISFGYKF